MSPNSRRSVLEVLHSIRYGTAFSSNTCRNVSFASRPSTSATAAPGDEYTCRQPSSSSAMSMPVSLSAQRTAAKQRPHQETERHQQAMSEPVVVHQGDQRGGHGHEEVQPSAFKGFLGGAPYDAMGTRFIAVDPEAVGNSDKTFGVGHAH